MEKNRITGLLVAITVALLGLMAIQVKWMRDGMRLREAQFERSMDHALFSVSDKLEQAEKWRDLKRHKAGRKLLRRLVALRREHDERVAARSERMESRLDEGLFPPSEPPNIPVLIADAEDMDRVGMDIPDIARRIAARFFPGLLTCIIPKQPTLPSAVSATSTVGVRAPDHDVARALLRAAGPMAVTSANLSGHPSPSTAEEVFAQLKLGASH